MCALGNMLSLVISVAIRNKTGKNAFPPNRSLIMGWYVFVLTNANPPEISGNEVTKAKIVAPNIIPLML